MTAEIDAQTVLDFWFVDEATGQQDVPRGGFWFNGGQTVDVAIREQFEATILAAALGAYTNWEDSASGSLALILLFDQMPRNIYRGTARAFEFSNKALAICKNGLAKQFPKELPITQRVFFYMPLEHSEAMADQQLSIELFSQLHQQAPDELRKFTEGTLQYAKDHQAVIERFGRYPHRNDVLGRASTDEEIAWLADKGTRFGQ